jgi:radical SAM protein with 4Fe4S-binding SPASM domain
MINNQEFSRKVANLLASFHPVNASIEVTSRCNATCGYCYITQEKKLPDLSFERMRAIIDKVYDAGVMFLCLTGGEPFARSDFLGLLSYCIEKNFFKISLLTNGTLIGDDHISLIGRYPNFFSYVRMSIFSHVPEIHDAYCGVAHAFRTILDNAGKLRDSGIRVVFSLNILDFNYKTYETTKEYLENLGFPVQVGISKLITTAALDKTLKPLTQKKFFLDYLRHSDKSKVLAYQEGLRQKMQDSPGSGELCAGLSSNIHIKANGDITPCASFRKLTVGNIFDGRPLPEILRDSKIYNQLRSMRKTDTPACRNCRYIEFCVHCLGVVHSEFNDFFHAPEQFCNFNKALHEIDYA